MKWLLGALASLPTPVMHALAYPAYLLLYRVLRYRRATVRDNLRHAFPDLDAATRRDIERRSYRHLANLFFEILRSTRMPQAEFARRVHFSNLELLERATDNYQRQAIVLLIHQGNWEWMLHGAMAQLPVAVDPVYKTLHSPFWDDFMLTARSRFGAEPMALEEVARAVIRGRRRRRLIVMLADQSGPRHGGYWTKFMHRPASFYRGAEKLARGLKLPLLFAQCRLRGTGDYEIRLHEVSMPPHEASDDELMERYVRLAETLIAEQPESYLWTNRRWKKRPPEEYSA
jgi:KDO2-lipid IV(A) lauroyltransferase